jgi:hypothetical protein
MCSPIASFPSTGTIPAQWMGGGEGGRLALDWAACDGNIFLLLLHLLFSVMYGRPSYLLFLYCYHVECIYQWLYVYIVSCKKYSGDVSCFRSIIIDHSDLDMNYESLSN